MILTDVQVYVVLSVSSRNTEYKKIASTELADVVLLHR